MQGTMEQREFDVILYGATGFTGQQTVRYFARYAPIGVRWAIAGRSQKRLEALGAEVPALVADATDSRAAMELASRTRVLLTTAGPFELYGDRLVEACVRTRTDYVDITGEVAWVRSLIDRFHAEAERNGTRIVPFCGFDSVPADLGVSLLVKQLGSGIAVAKSYFQVKGGRPNGGTIASAHRTYSSGADRVGRDPFLLSPGVERDARPIEADPRRALYDKEAGGWVAPFPMSIIDTRVVRRSCSLIGVDVAYQEYVLLKGVLGPVWATGASLGTALFYRALETPLFRDLARRTMQAGSGPSEAAMDGGYFRCRVWGRTGQGETAEVVLAGEGDPANRITVKCVCESALALACNVDQLPDRAGVLTPSVGIGGALVGRLRERGISIAVSAAQPDGRVA